MTQSKIAFSLDQNNHVYYVQEFDGQLILKEINPDNDGINNHLTIYERKSESILGF